MAELCKTCLAQHEAELPQAAASCAAEQPLCGHVRSAGRPLGGVHITVQGLAVQGVTDTVGAFNLGYVAADRKTLDAGTFFEVLQLNYPGGSEMWLREMMARGPPECERLFATVLRHSNIGAAINRETFIALATQPEVWRRIAASVYKGLGKSSDLVMCFCKEGFAPCSMPLAEMGIAIVEIDMQQVAVQGTVNPFQGGCLSDPESGASVTLFAGTRLVQADGTCYSGNVVMSLAVIDASKPALAVESMPGDFSALDVHGQQVHLETVGALWVGLEAAGGGSLQLEADSCGLTMEFQTEASINYDRLGAPPSLWEFDEATGKWQQDAQVNLAVDGITLPRAGQDPALVTLPERPEPRAVSLKKKKGKNDERHSNDFNDFRLGAPTWTPEAFSKLFGAPKVRTFQMRDIPRAGYWNCDNPYITTFLSGHILDADGRPLQVANVWSVGQSYVGASPRSGLGENGSFSILAQQGCQIFVYVLLPAVGGAAQPLKLSFGPFAAGAPGESKPLGALRVSDGIRLILAA